MRTSIYVHGRGETTMQQVKKPSKDNKRDKRGMRFSNEARLFFGMFCINETEVRIGSGIWSLYF